MQPRPDFDLLDLQLNETGKKYIRKFYKASEAVLLLIIIITVVDLWIYFKWIINTYNQDTSLENLKIPVWVRLSNYIHVVITIINLVGVFYYVKFAKALKNSVNSINEDSFNISFRYIYFNALIFLFVMLVNGISLLLPLSDFL